MKSEMLVFTLIDNESSDTAKKGRRRGLPDTDVILFGSLSVKVFICVYHVYCILVRQYQSTLTMVTSMRETNLNFFPATRLSVCVSEPGSGRCVSFSSKNCFRRKKRQQAIIS